MQKLLNKTYDPKSFEARIYSFWEENNYFKANTDKNKKPYTVVMPPPNITGKLHMGHALDETLQDIIIRFKRMQGFAALWVPGTDHASIATEAKIVEQMKQEGVKKENIGREAFLERAWAWKEKYGNEILKQLRRLGSSCDWSRERFTLDDGCSRAVKEVFVKLYKKGLIYKGEKIINWCPNCKTSISDAEVEFSERNGNFWYIKYPIKGESSFIKLATTRPETLLGDTAIAVNPEDERYSKYVGKKAVLPLIGREIPIIADEYVDPEFGTGVVKITPAHDPNDFEVGLRHNLPIINVMDESGYMNENAGKYKNLYKEDARKAIVSDLNNEGLLAEVEAIKHNVGACYRCGTVVEPRISKQWFVKMKPLADNALKRVKNGEVKFIPDRFSKIYYHWMENIKDWCISRQLWWGHRIPAYYCNDCNEIIVSAEEPTSCPKCGCKNLTQDADTLDTWFSSALWPFSSMGWPEQTEDLKYFYPTNTLITGYDIIFFWVSRMIFSAIEYTGTVPFNTVFIHGLIRDSQGRKMSKSLGNGVDPLEVIEKYGTDALRFSLIIGNSPGSDIRFTDEKLISSRNFANKIWNAARFIQMNIEGEKINLDLPEDLNIEDKWIISSLNSLAKEVNENIENFELGVAAQKLYDFIWEKFCDWYIEVAKIRLQTGESNCPANTKTVLVWVFANVLKLLHPFMPFITEEIWQTLPHAGDTIMLEKYPQYSDSNFFPNEEKEMNSTMNLIKCIRNRRAEMNVPPSKKTQLFIESLNDSCDFSKGENFIKKLGYATEIFFNKAVDPAGKVAIITNDAKIYIPSEELIDKEAEINRLNKQLEKAKAELSRCDEKLKNSVFLSKAPEKVVLEIKAKKQKFQDEIENLLTTVSKLQ